MATQKTVKKVDIKKVVKGNVVKEITSMYEEQGYQVSCGTDYGFTDSTLIIHLAECDIQVKMIAPGAKNGERYTKLEEE